jgi:predicted GNAT family N-acyltransferase
MDAPFDYRIEEVAWAEAADCLRAVRREVFVLEQHVPEALEWDGIDEDCRHVLAVDADGRPVGTGRLLPDGHIGRMAVLAAHRGRGVGGGMLDRLLGIAQARGDREAILSAQTHAVGFYRRFGFEVTSGEFIDAGIPHVEMRRQLA